MQNFNSTLLASLVLGVSIITGWYILAHKEVVNVNNPLPGTVQVAGEWHVFAEPDVFVLSIMVSEKAKTTKEAYSLMNTKVTEVKKALTDAWVDSKDIQTNQLMIQPEYDYSVPWTPKATGFFSNHGLTVKLRKLDSVNTILDKVVSIANVQIQNMTYDLDNKEIIYQKARKLALEKARQKADDIAKNANISLGRVQNINENAAYNPIYPMYGMGMVGNYAKMDMSNGGATGGNMSPGQLELPLTMNVTYELK